MSGGETDLNTLLRDLTPSLGQETYVYCRSSGGDGPFGPSGPFGRELSQELTPSTPSIRELDPFVTVREEEGLTMVLRQEDAYRAGFDCTHTFRCITLRVHSSLRAVGLTAAVSAELARHGVSANIVAGYCHDHVLVPSEQAEEALGHLQNLSRAARSR